MFTRTTLALTAALILWLTPLMAYANTLAPFAGNWRGTATGTTSEGKRERFKCNAYNATVGSNALRIVIRCANASSGLHIRAHIQTSGTRVHGTWEERTYNVSGNVRGSRAGNTISARITGGGYSAHVGISRAGNHLEVSIIGGGSFTVALNQ